MRSRFPIITLLLAALAMAAHAIPGVTEWLQFDRAAVARGEAWRWFTAHLTHFDLNHLAWDVGALLALGWTCEGHSRGRFVAAVILPAVAITPAVWIWQPQFTVYRGLSGIDSALFALLATSLLKRPWRFEKFTGAAALLSIAVKCIVELTTHTTLFADGEGYAPVPLAHAIGLLAGIVAALATLPASPTSRCAASSASPSPCR